MAITRVLLPLTCALFLPLAAAAQTTSAAPADACCGAMHQMPATGAAVDHSAHQAQALDAATPASPATPGTKADAAGCCGAEKSDKPMAKMDCCAGMDASGGTDATPCEHCAAKPVDKASVATSAAPAAGCCGEQAPTKGCC